MPDISFAMIPMYKNYTKYQEFIKKVHDQGFKTEEDYDSNVNEVFYNDGKDFISALNIAETFEETIKNMSRIPIEPPYVRVVLNEFHFEGFRAVISLEALNNFLVQEKELKKEDKDFSFDLLMVLNVCTLLFDCRVILSFYHHIFLYLQVPGNLTDMNFLVKINMGGDDSLHSNPNLAGSTTLTMSPDKFQVYQLDFELKTLFRKCDDVARITPCIKKFFKNQFGSNYQNQSVALYEEHFFLYEGEEAIFKKAGCQLPCQQTIYKMNEYLNFKMKYFPSEDFKAIRSAFPNSENSPIILISHRKSDYIIQHKEVLEYDLSRIISEVGGIVGIFLGLSFWSIYLDFIAPIFPFIKAKLNNSALHN